MRLIVRRDLSEAHEKVDENERAIGFELSGVKQSDDLFKREKLCTA